MKMLKCKSGSLLMFETDTSAYWVVTEICGRVAWLFAGGTADKAERVWNWYVKGKAA